MRSRTGMSLLGTASRCALAAGIAGAGAEMAAGQVACSATGGADVAIGDMIGVSSWGSLDGVAAYSIGASLCNLGPTALGFFPNTTQHPAYAANLYRLKTVGGAARFEQIGMGWVYHTFSPLSQNVCCSGCVAGDSNHLGVRCSDPESSGIAGSRNLLGPRFQVNAATGSFVYPPANPGYTGAIARRLQAHIADLDPSQAGGGQYFLEQIIVSPEDGAAGNTGNNASFRACTVAGNGTSWTLGISGSTQAGRAAIRAWHDVDPTVVERDIQVPGDGTLVLASRATDLGGGQWRYEYALENISSDRAAQSFEVTYPGAVESNFGFHDVDYHDGDGEGSVTVSGADWTVGIAGGGALAWSTDLYSFNPNANALRWGTLYNFRFDANAPPLAGGGTAYITLFKPGTPTEVSVTGVVVPGSPTPICRADWDRDGFITPADVGAFVVAWFTSLSGGTLAGDYDGNGVVQPADVASFIQAWFAALSGPCPP